MGAWLDGQELDLSENTEYLIIFIFLFSFKESEIPNGNGHAASFHDEPER